MDCGTLGEVRDTSRDPRGGPGQIRGPSERSGTGQGTLWEVRDGSGDLRGGPGRIGGPLGRSESGPRTLPEVRNGLGDLQKIWDGTGDPPGCP